MNPRKTSKHIVNPINLIIPIIINYQLSIERSSLVSYLQSSIFFTRRSRCPWRYKKALFLHPLPQGYSLAIYTRV